MQDKYKQDIVDLLTKYGPMGVNAISRHLDANVSTIQKYLIKQNYFVKNEQRHWDLPERVEKVAVVKAIDNFDTVIDSQLKSVQAMYELLQNNIESTINLLNNQRTILPASPAVAKVGNVGNVGYKLSDPRLIKMDRDAVELVGIFKKQKDNVPDEYKDLLFNFDPISVLFKEGREYLNTFLEDEIFELIMGKITSLNEETVEILKDNQKSDNPE